MSLVIENGIANWIITIQNSNGGTSSLSSVAIATSLDSALDQSAVDRIANVHRDGLKGAWDNGWSVGPVKAYEREAGVLHIWENGTTEAGTATAADYASPAVSWIVHKGTSLAGRQFRGRMYMPGVIETKVGEDGLLDATYRSDLQTVISTWWANLLADAAINAVRLLHDSSSPGSHASNVITDLIVQNRVGTMRPRQRRR